MRTKGHWERPRQWVPASASAVRIRRILAVGVVGLMLAGCAPADKNQEPSPASSSAPAASASSSSSGMSGMAGMAGMGTSSKSKSKAKAQAAVPEVDGQKPVPTQVLATADWQGMEIQAETRTPVSFVIFNGNQEHMVAPPKRASFHLMIMLSDQRTGEPIPYSSSVWATITNQQGKIVFDDGQWPMISRYMGPHYGNDVPYLPSGRYKLSVLVGPPTSARAVEYKSVWLKAHRVTAYFDWNAKTGIATMAGDGKDGASDSMAGMAMGAASAHPNVTVNGVRAKPSQLLATAAWQGMKIQARSANPTPFYMFTGDGTEAVEPASGSSFYLMVTLQDEFTSAAITYAPVHATIRSGAKVVYSGALEPTISAFQGPFYANNVKLPEPGRYTLELRIDPPRQARHLEYEHVWLAPHTVVEHFVWDGK